MIQNKVFYESNLDLYDEKYVGCSFRSDELRLLGKNVYFESCNFNCSKVDLRLIKFEFNNCRIFGELKLHPHQLLSFSNCVVRELRLDYLTGGIIDDILKLKELRKIGLDYGVDFSVESRPSIFSPYDSIHGGPFAIRSAAEMDRELERNNKKKNEDFYDNIPSGVEVVVKDRFRFLRMDLLEHKHYDAMGNFEPFLSKVYYFEHLETGLEFTMISGPEDRPVMVMKNLLTQGEANRLVGHDFDSKFKGDNLPVDNMRFSESIELSKALKLELMHVSDWSYYAYGHNLSDAYPWGSYYGVFCDYVTMGCGRTNPVGIRLPNSYGLYDMIGNVNEWCIEEDSGTVHGLAMGGSHECNPHNISGISNFYLPQINLSDCGVRFIYKL